MTTLASGDRFFSLRSFFLRLYFLFRRHMTMAVAAPILVQSVSHSLWHDCEMGRQLVVG